MKVGDWVTMSVKATIYEGMEVEMTSMGKSGRSLVMYTIVKAMLHVTEGLGVRIKFCHTGRGLDDKEKIDDHLSKGELNKARMVSPWCRQTGWRCRGRLVNGLAKSGQMFI